MATRNLDQAIALIKRWEGCVLKVYKDVGGLPTIGYGHLLQHDEHIEELTQQEAEDLLIRDVERIAKAIRRDIKYPYMSDNEFCALVSFAFNLGPQSLLTSTLLRLYNKGMIQEAADEFLKWVFANGKRLKGLERRRKSERQLFLSP